MSDDVPPVGGEELMILAEEFQKVVKMHSDILLGAIKTLEDEGWDEKEAHEIAFAAWKQAIN